MKLKIELHNKYTLFLYTDTIRNYFVNTIGICFEDYMGFTNGESEWL